MSDSRDADRRPQPERLRATAFVLAAVLLTLAVVSFAHRRDSSQARRSPVVVRISPAGAAPGPTPITPRQTHVFGSSQSPAEVAAAAAGAPGQPGPVSALTPLSKSAFRAPFARYRAYAGNETALLLARVTRLTAALRDGDRARAETDWNAADSAFDRLGDAYGVLGPLGDRIDGSPGGLPGGTADPRFTGLHRIEYGLWTGQPTRSLVGLGVRLHGDVATLHRAVASAPMDPLEYSTRAHEILEDAQRDELSGAISPWSESGVRATADGLVATRVVLGTLSNVLAGRGDALAQSTYRLTELGRELSSIRAAHGGRYPTLAQLSRMQRETLDGRLGAALEALAGIPGELETTLPVTITPISR